MNDVVKLVDVICLASVCRCSLDTPGNRRLAHVAQLGANCFKRLPVCGNQQHAWASMVSLARDVSQNSLKSAFQFLQGAELFRARNQDPFSGLPSRYCIILYLKSCVLLWCWLWAKLSVASVSAVNCVCNQPRLITNRYVSNIFPLTVFSVSVAKGFSVEVVV